ncbi:MAG: hypothetical protein AAF518_13780, partial [Spirochaetota bacterium]
EWLPNDYFHKNQRHILTYYLEEVLLQKEITHLFSVGIYRCGFSATVAAKLINCLHIPILLYEDSFSYHLNNAEAIQVVLQNSQFAACFNPSVQLHTQAFYPSLLCPAILTIDSPVQTLSEEQGEYEFKYIQKVTQRKPYVLTSGILDESHHLPDLLQRMGVYLRQGKLWVHAGVISPNFLQKLSVKLALLSYPDSLYITGILSRSKFLAFLQKADLVLVAKGKRDTGVLESEAKSLAKILDLPNLVTETKPSVPKNIISDWLSEVIA